MIWQIYDNWTKACQNMALRWFSQKKKNIRNKRNSGNESIFWRWIAFASCINATRSFHLYSYVLLGKDRASSIGIRLRFFYKYSFTFLLIYWSIVYRQWHNNLINWYAHTFQHYAHAHKHTHTPIVQYAVCWAGVVGTRIGLIRFKSEHKLESYRYEPSTGTNTRACVWKIGRRNNK